MEKYQNGISDDHNKQCNPKRTLRADPPPFGKDARDQTCRNGKYREREGVGKKANRFALPRYLGRLGK